VEDRVVAPEPAWAVFNLRLCAYWIFAAGCGRTGMLPGGADLRSPPLIERKRRLARLIGKAKHAIRFVEHLTDDGPTVFDHVCRMGLEGIVSKRTDTPYRSGPSKVWIKSKNPASEAVRREREEDWNRPVKPHSSSRSRFTLPRFNSSSRYASSS
jgi:hypothetical protein